MIMESLVLQLKQAQSDEKVAAPVDKNLPSLSNLNEDPMLSYIMCHYLTTDEVTIGSRNSTICLNGLSILERHAVIRRLDADHHQLIPAEPGSKIKLNGYNLNG